MDDQWDAEEIRWRLIRVGQDAAAVCAETAKIMRQSRRLLEEIRRQREEPRRAREGKSTPNPGKADWFTPRPEPLGNRRAWRDLPLRMDASP
jgi:hypothetical protein